MISGKWIQPGQPFDDALAVRRAVFVEEQGFPADSEPDALDSVSWQVVIYSDEVPVATGRIYWAEGEFRLGRICVLREYRGQSIGDALMRLLIAKALDHAAPSLALSAQEQAMPFYARYGFEAQGEAYREDGVPHRRMRAPSVALEALFQCANCAGCSERGGCLNG